MIVTEDILDSKKSGSIILPFGLLFGLLICKKTRVKKGIKKGKKEGKIDIAKNLKENGVDISLIAK